MLTRKILSSTAVFAMTASIALLAGCPSGTQVVTPTDDPNATATPATTTPTATPATVAPTATPATVAPTTPSTVAPTATGTSTPAPTNSSIPVGQTGGTSDIKERATFNGKVYDPNGIPVEGATINAKSVDTQVSWVGEQQISTNGAYVFRNAPVGARVEVTATKDGWTTRVRTEVLKSNLQGDPTANVFDFGGANGNDATARFYAIQDEPEVISIKINGRLVNTAGSTGARANGGGGTVATLEPDPLDAGGGKPNLTNASSSLSGVDTDRLDVELNFSEPVDREDVQNNFKAVSQRFQNKSVRNAAGLLVSQNFTVDENLGTISFTWATDDKSVLIKTNRPILSKNNSPEARYLIRWANPFTDKTDKSALVVGSATISPTGHFRFSPGTNNDFTVFSVKIDDQSPRLLSVSALDGGASNDIIRLTFNEPLEVVNKASDAFGLADPLNPTSIADQLWAFNTAIGTFAAGSGTNPLGNSADNATVVGYNDSKDPTVANRGFKGVFMIGKLVSPIARDASGRVNFLQALSAGIASGSTVASATPTRGGVAAGVTNFLLRFAKINGNEVTLEFTPEAFKRDDKILVSVGQNINTTYNDANFSDGVVGLTGNISVALPGAPGGVNTVFSNEIRDPAGNTMSQSNSTTSANTTVNDSLRVSTAS